MAAVRQATPPVSHSSPAFQVREGDLVPESMAYDPKGKQFYFGSMRKGKVVRCSGGGECAEFVSGLGLVLGLKANGDGLWVLSNSDGESALIRYELRSGREIGRFTVAGPGHSFNDLTIAAIGDIYLTDTAVGAVWRLAKGSPALARLPGRFEAANGIALSSNGKLLYVSTFPDGILVMDLKTGTAVPLKRPGNVSLTFVDGLYCRGGALIAIQNGYMSPRVVRLKLAGDGRGVERLEILERRNPGFDGITTGVMADGEFFYMSNIQDEKKSGFEAIRILKLRL
jgi:sugar lactone lactonase YvrE